MTDLAERLRNVQTFIGVAELRIEAADEIERMRTDKDQLIAIASDEMRKRDAEIKRLEAERDEWKQAAQVEAGLRREFQAEIERIIQSGMRISHAAIAITSAGKSE